MVNSKKVEYGFRVIDAAFPSLFGFGIRGRSYSNFVAYTVYGTWFLAYDTWYVVYCIVYSMWYMVCKHRRVLQGNLHDYQRYGPKYSASTSCW